MIAGDSVDADGEALEGVAVEAAVFLIQLLVVVAQQLSDRRVRLVRGEGRGVSD